MAVATRAPAPYDIKTPRGLPPPQNVLSHVTRVIHKESFFADQYLAERRLCYRSAAFPALLFPTSYVGDLVCFVDHSSVSFSRLYEFLFAVHALKDIRSNLVTTIQGFAFVHIQHRGKHPLGSLEKCWNILIDVPFICSHNTFHAHFAFTLTSFHRRKKSY